MVQAAPFGSQYIDPPAGCEFQTMAKDGIYLNDMPRSVPKLILVPGQRADVAVRCTNVGSQPVKALWWMGDFGGSATNGNTYHIDVMQLNIVSSTSLPVSLPPLPLGFRRPCYIADLTTQVIQAGNSFELEFAFTNGSGKVNGMPWHNETTYVHTTSLGTVQEVVDKTTGNHPYHQHVNPFQIASIDAEPIGIEEYDTANRAWYKVGDWHDTIMYPVNNTDPTVKLRYAADQFSGHMIFHCHLLSHEDQGMMAQYDLVGEEGTLWDGARTVDPTCILPFEFTPSPTPNPTSMPSKAGKQGKQTKQTKAPKRV